MRIVFFGTPDFAVASLKSLVNHGYQVVGVVTATDKWLGRGHEKKLVATPVKQYALEKGIPVLQPEKLRNPDFLQALQDLQADIQVIVAFRMLPEMVWNMPPMGTINVHASLLPKYRGAAPINWAIINGEKETGVTTFRLQHEIDTGNILCQLKTPIAPEENAGSLHDRLMKLGADCVVQTLELLERHPDAGTPQPDEAPIKAPKLFLDNCKIDFHQTTDEVYNFIRGLSPYPAAWTDFDQKIMKIYVAHKNEKIPGIEPGQVYTDYKNIFAFGTIDGSIQIDSLQIEGKRKMGVAEFLRGIQGHRKL
jgi:methionyl-tRNA formyltransferase